MKAGSVPTSISAPSHLLHDHPEVILARSLWAIAPIHPIARGDLLSALSA